MDCSLEGKLNFLEQNIEPWSTIVQYWTDTSKQRIAKILIKSTITKRNTGKRIDQRNANSQNKLKNKAISKTTQIEEEQKEMGNISTYLNKYPALKEILGYTLVNI